MECWACGLPFVRRLVHASMKYIHYAFVYESTVSKMYAECFFFMNDILKNKNVFLPMKKILYSFASSFFVQQSNVRLMPKYGEIGGASTCGHSIHDNCHSYEFIFSNYSIFEV